MITAEKTSKRLAFYKVEFTCIALGKKCSLEQKVMMPYKTVSGRPGMDSLLKASLKGRILHRFSAFHMSDTKVKKITEITEEEFCAGLETQGIFSVRTMETDV